MNSYKRNQVEEAVLSVLTPTGPAQFRLVLTQIKRLLEADRALKDAEDAKEANRTNYAFFSEAPPGSGAEIMFSEYEAFALFVALTLLVHQWPQSFVVKVLQEVRPELEREHFRVLQSDPASLFDAAAPQKWAAEGQPPFDNWDPVLLTIVSNRGQGKAQQATPYAVAVRRKMSEAITFANEVEPIGGAAWSFLDVTPAAHKMRTELSKTRPRVRGRGRS